MTVAARQIRLIMQLRRAGIGDTAVLSAIERIPREVFVPDSFRDQAYEDIALPIGQGQTLSRPQVVAAMTQALRLDRRLKVLEIGTGSGYQAAVLARLCRRLYTIERHRQLLATAEQRFARLGLHNITCRAGDGSKGWPEQAPFSRIVVTAASPQVPAALVDQLAINGVLIAPVGRPGAMQELVRVTRHEAGMSEESLGPVRFVPLVAGPAAPGSANVTAIEAAAAAARSGP